jgi:hypothetical protein
MRFRKPSPATLIALVALFVALGGSSYAALQVPKGSVATNQLKNNAVTSPKVRNNSLLLRDFRASQRSLLRGPQGERGPQGVAGAAGNVNTNLNINGSAAASSAFAPASASAFAHVNPNGTLDSANSRNVALRARPVPGAYCLDVTAAQTPQSVVATLDISATGAATDKIRATVVPAVVNFNCPGTGADTLIDTTNAGGVGVTRGFYVVFN